MESENVNGPVDLQPGQRSNPYHPGEILKTQFLEPREMTQRELAEEIKVYYPRVNQIINGKRGITVDTAARLAKFFDTSPQFWLNLQQSYELHQLKQDSDWEEIEEIRPAS